MAGHEGVDQVHDLHAWQITSGFPTLSAHALAGPDVDCHRIRFELEALLLERFGIEHTTFQVGHTVEARLLRIETLRHSGKQ